MRKSAIVVMVGSVWLVSFSQVSHAGSSRVASQYENNFQQDACRAMTRAADFLVAVQKPAPQEAVGWSWRVDTGPVSKNVAGLAALALLSAYSITKDENYLDTATRYANGLLASRAQWSSENLPFKADIVFLAGFAEVTGDMRFVDLATEAFALIRSRSPDGASEVARIASGRAKTPALLGFDVALAIRAANAISERQYAYQMAEAVVGSMDNWYQPKKHARFSLLSGAALAKALLELDAGHYRKEIALFRSDLQRSQQASGAWLSNETQASAYAIMALVDGSPAQREVAQKGIEWLKSTMLKKGSYAIYNDYMPEPFVGQVISEVHAEALSALASACRNN